MLTKNKCPKCKQKYNSGLNKCPHCGTVYFDLSHFQLSNKPFYIRLNIGTRFKPVIVTQRVNANEMADIIYSIEKPNRRTNYKVKLKGSGKMTINF